MTNEQCEMTFYKSENGLALYANSGPKAVQCIVMIHYRGTSVLCFSKLKATCQATNHNPVARACPTAVEPNSSKLRKRGLHLADADHPYWCNYEHMSSETTVNKWVKPTNSGLCFPSETKTRLQADLHLPHTRLRREVDSCMQRGGTSSNIEPLFLVISQHQRGRQPKD